MATGRGYERKGDPFTLKVQRGEGPPCVHQYTKRNTGRTYFTRVCVHKCLRLDAVKVAQALREHAQHLSAGRPEPVTVPQVVKALGGVHWDAPSGAVNLFSKREPVEPSPGRGAVFGLQLTATGAPDARGVRVWLTCPRCSRRCGVLYAAPYGRGGVLPRGQYVMGCRDCLGLTDASRQRHKCLEWSSAVLGQRSYKEGRRGWYQTRGRYGGFMTRERAHRVFMASFGRAFKGLGIPMPGSEE